MPTVRTDTGIDTKGGKRGVLHVPKWFYEQLHVYAGSVRARGRRLKAVGEDHADQFLFLSRNGNPFYEARERHNLPKPDRRAKRHVTSG